MKKFRRIIFGLLIIMICVIVVGYLDNYHLVVNQHSMESEKIDESIKLVIISDLHDRCFGNENQSLIRKIESLKPDIILILGDMLNGSSNNSEIITKLLGKLINIAPIYYALGNHEYDYINSTGEDLFQILSSIGINIVEENFFDIQVNDQRIRIGGLYDYAFAIGIGSDNSTKQELMKPEVYQFLTSFQATDAYKIMLSHRPDSFIFGEASKTWDIDLVVSGHLHGGQVVFPFIGGLYGGDQGFFPEYVHGLYQKDLLQILITSGLGSHKETLPRWNNPPEIMLLELK